MTYRVRLRMGDFEIEVEGDKAFIEKQLKRFTDRPHSVMRSTAPAEFLTKSTSSHKPVGALSPAEYYRQKRPEGGTATLLVFAKFLDEYRGKGEFTRADIGKVAAEAKTKNLHSEYYRLAVKQGLLRTIGKGRFGLTISGEDVVAAMPAKRKTED